MMDASVVCFPFTGTSVAGSSISALHLIRGLQGTGFRPVVIAHEPTGPLAEVFRHHGIEVLPAPTRHYIDKKRGRLVRQTTAWAQDVSQMAQFLRDYSVRILHTNDRPMHLSWLVPARMAKVKCVWHHRGQAFPPSLRAFTRLGPHRLLAVSEFAAQGLGGLARSGKCQVIYNPFEIPSAPADRQGWRQNLLAEAGLATSSIVVGYCGHFGKRKRPAVFIDIVGEVKRRLNGRAVFAPMFGNCDPKLNGALEERARAQGVASEVRLMGFRYPPEPWLGGCDVLVVPSVDEPLGRTIIEAMALGTPVVAARSGGNAEIITHGETGFLATADDPQSFADYVCEVVEGRSPEIAAKARANVESRFGVARHVKEICEVYRGLLDNRRDPVAVAIASSKRRC